MPRFKLATPTDCVTAPHPSPRARVHYNQTMRLVRRAHLYTALFMTPWVFLYGVTAFLFNHPDAFPDRPVHAIGQRELSGGSLGALPQPQALATRVIAALNTSEGERGDSRGYSLVSLSEASYARELVATATGGEHQYGVRLDLDTGQGTVREIGEPKRPATEPAPFATRSLTVPDPPPLADVKDALATALTRSGVRVDTVAVRSNPELSFLIKGQGRTWRVRYDLTSGAVAGEPEGNREGEISSRRFLTRLHMAHGYPGRLGAQWTWAVAVDLMSVSMVGWGITGLLMWWQMKNVRRVGAVVLAISLVAAATIAIGMHGSLASSVAPGHVESPGGEKPTGPREERPKSRGTREYPSPKKLDGTQPASDMRFPL